MPDALFVFAQADDRAGVDALFQRDLVAQRGLGEAQCATPDFGYFPALAIGANQLGRRFQNHGGDQVIVVSGLLQRFFEILFTAAFF